MKRSHQPLEHLDALILHAEHAVIESDRKLVRDLDALTQSWREHSGRLSLLGVAAVSALLLGMWLLNRPRDKRRPPL